MWCREESLSSVLSVEMLDLPVSDIQAQMQDEFGSQKSKMLKYGWGSVKNSFSSRHCISVNVCLLKFV